MAAVELGVTPSAVQKRLDQLRAELKDQLLIRRGDRTMLTRRAECLVEPLGATLRALDTLFAEDQKQQSRANATIAMRDQFVLTLAPRLMRQLAAESPHTTLKILSCEYERLVDELIRGTADVAVAADPPNIRDLLTTPLYREKFVCVTGDRAPLTLERYLRAAHVAMSHSGSALIDETLARRGYKRRIVAQVPHFAALLRAVESQGLCATLPCGVVVAMHPSNLFVHNPPLAIPDLQVSMVWHRRREQDPDNRWLRSVLMSAAQTGLGTIRNTWQSSDAPSESDLVHNP
jgi:DNA-binding transcriptional LysR family regulator